MDPKSLAIALATTEKEDEIIDILTQLGYWNDLSYWRPFGDNENNFSTIGNQQSKADAALVEKLINSVDAILMKECMVHGIDMTGSEAPNTMKEALNRFFNIREGQLSYLDVKKRNKMAEDIILAATGNKKGTLNLTIADKGEGQTPKEMPNTILSVSKDNKLRVPFVQGKFNMGGTGVLPFCGNNRFQLVISKRCPDIPNYDSDETFDYWSVTLVRREFAHDGRKSSMFTYLTDKNKGLFKFKADSLPIIPLPQRGGYENFTDYGTYIKLYNYAFQGYKSNVLFDFNYRMSMLMPELAHPIRIRECRDYEGHSFEVTLSGLQTRLDEDGQRDGKKNIEDGFPSSDTFNIDGQNFKCCIYIFKKETGKSGEEKKEPAKNYREKDGVLFTVNGQTHAVISESFFNKVNLSYLADSILVLIDCSEIDVQHREDMFMNSRDRLRNCVFVKEITERIKEILKEHEGLKRIQNERRAKAVQNRLSEDKPLQDVLKHILTKSPVLSKIFISGNRISNPFNFNPNAGETTSYKGKKHPTFFNIRGKLTNGLFKKKVPKNHNFRLQFETDVSNDYFVRPVEKGELLLKMDGVPHPELLKHLGLFNGVATLTIELPPNPIEQDEHEYQISIIDDYIVQSFETDVHVIVDKAEDYNSGASGGRVSPRDPQKKGSNNEPDRIAMPNIEEKYKDDWNQFGMDEHTALKVYSAEEGKDYFLNMDNQYLATELKGIRDSNRMMLTKARYKYSMALIAMSIESYYKNKENGDESVDVAEEIAKITTMISPILVPMLETMSELDINDI